MNPFSVRLSVLEYEQAVWAKLVREQRAPEGPLLVTIVVDRLEPLEECLFQLEVIAQTKIPKPESRQAARRLAKKVREAFYAANPGILLVAFAGGVGR